MSRNQWGPEGPPAEAYSGVTNPGRFAPLHEFAESLLDRLESEFDVDRREGIELDPELKAHDLARPSIELTPRTPDGARLLVSFTTFPGLVVRAGQWHSEPIPSCGCDACDESAESAIERLSWLVENVTRGRFREALSLPLLLGDAWKTTEMGASDVGRRESGRMRIPRQRASEMLANSRNDYQWKPGPRR